MPQLELGSWSRSESRARSPSEAPHSPIQRAGPGEHTNLSPLEPEALEDVILLRLGNSSPALSPPPARAGRGA